VILPGMRPAGLNGIESQDENSEDEFERWKREKDAK